MNVKYPVLKVVSMDDRCEFVHQLYDAGYEIGGYDTALAGWDYFINECGANDQDWIYWGVNAAGLITIQCNTYGDKVVVNSAAQFFAYLKHLAAPIK